MIDIILASGKDDNRFASISKRFDEVVKGMETLKNMITSPDSIINKNYAELKSQVNRQADIIVKQQQYLESLDRREHEGNIVLLGIPDEYESLDAAVNDQDKINKLWSKIGVDSVAGTHRSLGGCVADGDGPLHRCPILMMLHDKNQCTAILENVRYLNDSYDIFNRIYITKDVHPSIMRE